MATTDALADYKHKRHFARTPEPRAVVAKPKQALSFVVQKHAARQLHYDFRLELDGTLKSWAVPKGPSLDPSVKRMAVHVEDHPLSYVDFEGVIPPKQYGAGTVIVWDRGTWIPLEDPHAGYRNGKLKFELRGVKLKGRWALVRMKRRPGERQEAWLLIKEDDEAARPAGEFDITQALPDSVLGSPPPATASTTAESTKAAKRRPRAAREAPAKHRALTKRVFAKPDGRQRSATAGPPLPAKAVPAPLPLTLAPQLAVLVDRVPEGDDWVYEIKFDGYRLLTRIEGSQVRCFTRNGNDWSSKMPSLVTDLQALGLSSGWIDGEIVVPGPDGLPNFQALQNAFDGRHTERLQYFVFDLPYFAGYDLRDVPLHERRAVLSALIGATTPPSIRYSETFDAPADELLESARKLGLEGLIGKRRDSVYRSRRSPDWIKLKCSQRQEFVIGGYTEPKGSRTGLGALLLGVHDAQTGELRYAGNVGTGFNEETLRDLKQRLTKLHVSASPFVDAPSSVKAHWVRPTLLAEVSFSEWTRDRRIRHPVFQGLRSDKPVVGITREVASPVKEPAPRNTAPASAPLRITHPERVIDPSTGLTKGDLVRYYASVAQPMLPHLHERPVALLRAPRGVKGPMFFQKHVDSGSELPYVDLLDPSLDPDHAPLLGISSAEALASIAQMNVIEVHTWNATTRAIDRPDRIVFDLDPGEGVGWTQVQEATHLLHAFLDELELASFLKTSGGKGLHVVVPLLPEHDWDTVKQLAQAIVVHLTAVIPKRFVAKSGPKNRVGRIYIDYLRNAFGATTVAAWSARARTGLGVSVPIAWDELDTLRSGAHWNVANVGERLAQGNAPWDAYEASRQKLAHAMKQLGIDPSRK